MEIYSTVGERVISKIDDATAMEKKYRDPSEFRVSSEASGSTLQFSTMGEQEEYLLGMKLKADLEASRSRNGPRCYTSRSSYLIVLLVLLNMMVLLALLLTLVLHMNRIENTSRNPNPWSSWLPPNRLHKKIFNYKPIYPAENAEEAQKARTNLIPGMLKRDPAKTMRLTISQWEKDLSLLGMTQFFQKCHS